MSTEIVKIDLSREQIDFIKRTVAKGATDDELKLYLHDCKRRGIDPLDKLLHFTVRTDKSGKRTYTPITSIDFMRIRASESGEYAGNDDPAFVFEDGDNLNFPVSATVTVWRMVQGQRCPFTATARWAEYHPDLSQSSSFMWKKMPCGQLGKCAEALALRKGFPGQLQGLYAKEEMDQASGQERMGSEQAQAYVGEQMDKLKTVATIKAEDKPAFALRPNGDPVGQEPQSDYVPYEEADSEIRFTLVAVKSTTDSGKPLKSKKGDPFRRVVWKEGFANCFIKEEFDTLDKLRPGQVVSAEITRNGDRINIKRIYEGAAPPEPKGDWLTDEIPGLAESVAMLPETPIDDNDIPF